MKSGALLLTALVAVLTSWAQTTVSWTLDLNGETPSADGVYLVGSFNGWILGADALTPHAENPNYYHISKELAPGVHEYKFVNGLDWSEVEPVPEACQFDESTNRWVEVQPGGGEFELSYCWNRCASCQLTSVLFRVNMEDQPIDPAGVHVAGDFQGWYPDTHPMADADGDGIWEALYSFDEAWLGLENEMHFKFLNGDEWIDAESVEGACADGYGNRSILLDAGTDLVVGLGEQSADASAAPCFNSCTACQWTAVWFRVDMGDQIIHPAGVHVAGDFQGWLPDTHPMSDEDGDGIWEAWYSFEAAIFSESLNFKFINGNTWEDAESVYGGCGDGNGNRSMALGGDTVVVSGWGTDDSYAPCFGSCDPCTSEVTFRADLSGMEGEVGTVSIGGPWNSWSQNTTFLEPTGEAGIWSVTLSLQRNTTIPFKFAHNGAYEFTDFGVDCAVFDDSPYHNRLVTTGDVGTTVEYTGCFGACSIPEDPLLNCAGDCLLDSDGDGICDALDWNACTDAEACNLGALGYGLEPCVYPLVGSDCDAGAAACGEGTAWNSTTQTCEIALPMDGNFDACVGTSDLLILLSQFGFCLE